MGTIYQRGNIYWIKYYRHGKPIVKVLNPPKKLMRKDC